LFLIFASGLTGCGRQVKARESVVYRFKPGKTALYQNGLAYAPKRAPRAVKRAIEAGNRLQNSPYKWGGGRKGPRWNPNPRPGKGHVMRHLHGL